LKANRLQNFINYTIIFLLPIEFLSIGEYFSTFRLVIFPLSILGIIVMKSKFLSSQRNIILLVMLCLTFSIFSNLIYELKYGFNAYLNSIGILIFIAYLLLYYNNFGFDFKQIKVISYYTIYCIIPLVLFYFLDINYDFFHNLRFKGFHKDPNFFCAYINISLAAKYIYLYVKKKFDLILVSFILIDIFSILLTQSRGGIITTILIIFIFIFLYRKKIIPGLIIISIIFVTFILKRIESLRYDNIDNLFDAILFRFSYKNYKGDSVEDARSGHIENFFEIISNKDQIIFGYSSGRYVETFDSYPHNLFIDICLEYGLFVGTFLTFIIFKFILKGYLNFKNNIYSHYYFIAISALINIIPLSSLNQKFFWFILILLYLSNKKIYDYQ